MIHCRKLKSWGTELINEFTDDFENIEEEIEELVDESGDFSIAGPMNYLFPLMLKQNFYEAFKKDQLNQYVLPMKEYIILPYKINMFHYYAFFNEQDCCSIALGCK